MRANVGLWVASGFATQLGQRLFGLGNVDLQTLDLVEIAQGDRSGHVVAQGLQLVFRKADQVCDFHFYTSGMSSWQMVEPLA